MELYLQIFYAKARPREFEPRQLAVVWRGDEVVDKGSPDEMRQKYPGVKERTEPQVWLSVQDLENFNVNVGNPLQVSPDTSRRENARKQH
jgi:hypothetical protein